MSLFRTEVIDASRRKLWGEVKLAQPPSLTIWTGILSAVSLAVVLGLVFGTYVKKETVRGYLAPEGGIVNISASHGGRIAKILVREGDHVKSGTPLIEFSGESVGAETGQVFAAQMVQVEQQIQNTKLRQAASQTNLDGDIQRIKDQIQANSVSKGLLGKRLADKIKLLDMLNDELGRYETLAVNGYASQIQINQRKQQILLQQDDLNNLETQVATLDANTADLKTQLRLKPATASDLNATANTELSTLEQKRIDLSANSRFIERAPVDGVVSNMQAELGQTPVVNLPLVSMMPDGSALQAELLVPTRAAGFLSPGDEARLQIDAYPFARFGFVTGRVLSVSKSVINPNEFLAPIEIKESVYRVKVILDKDYVLAYGEKKRLRPGMALTADIVIDKKPIWRQLFDPLMAAAQRSQ